MNPKAPAISALLQALASNREPSAEERLAAINEALAMVTDFLDDVRRIAKASEAARNWSGLNPQAPTT